MIRLVLCCIAVSSGLTQTVFAQTEIWLSPLTTVTPDGTGEIDYKDMIPDTHGWELVSRNVRVFKIYPFYAGRATDAELVSLIKQLKSHSIALALEGRVLANTRGCKSDEGDGGRYTLPLLKRIKRLGGEVAYLAMDEPLKHVLQGDAKCQASFADAAKDLAETVHAFRAIFPNMAVGDVEPVGSWPNNRTTLLPDLLRWVRAYQSAMGEPMAFFHADVGWNTPWLEVCSDLQSALVPLHVKFGIIYNGNDLAHSDTEWATEAKEHFKAFEDGHRPRPTAAVFQSWVRFPTHLLPESNPDSLTGVVAAYLAFHHKAVP